MTHLKKKNEKNQTNPTGQKQLNERCVEVLHVCNIYVQKEGMAFLFTRFDSYYE